MCYVDSPCYVMNKRYRCSEDGRHYQRYQEIPCSAVCGNRPCSGGGCRLDGTEQACPSGRACRPSQDISSDPPCADTLDAGVSVADAGPDAGRFDVPDGNLGLDAAPDMRIDGPESIDALRESDSGTDLPGFAVDGALAAFCSGAAPHMIINGIESHPAVNAKRLCYSCCMAGTFELNTATFIDPVFVSWTLPGGPVRAGEVWTRDLAELPVDYPLRIVIGCDPIYESMLCRSTGHACASVGEIHESGFTGELQLVGMSDGVIDGSICLRFRAAGGDAGASLQSLDLYVPHATFTE